jgi:hypothetical protein
MGRLKIVPTIEPWQRELGESLSDILGDAAPEMIKRIFEREDRGDILADFKTYFATPMMQMWKSDIAPIVTEGFNLPGAFYSKSRFEGLIKSGEEFLSERINPLLFSSLDTSRQRDLQRQAIIANIMTGTQSFATAPTQTGVMAPSGGSSKGAGIGAIAGLAAGMLIPGLGPALGGLSGLEMGAMGGMIGGQF